MDLAFRATSSRRRGNRRRRLFITSDARKHGTRHTRTAPRTPRLNRCKFLRSRTFLTIHFRVSFRLSVVPDETIFQFS